MQVQVVFSRNIFRTDSQLKRGISSGSLHRDDLLRVATLCVKRAYLQHDAVNGLYKVEVIFFVYPLLPIFEGVFFFKMFPGFAFLSW